jgi:hypothetical protein
MYGDIDTDRANVFLQNTTSLEANCQTVQEYKIAATIIGAIAAQKRINTEPKLARLIETQEERLDYRERILVN